MYKLEIRRIVRSSRRKNIRIAKTKKTSSLKFGALLFVPKNWGMFESQAT